MKSCELCLGLGGFYFFIFQIIHLVFVLVPFDHLSSEIRLKSPAPSAVLELIPPPLFFKIFLALFLRFSIAIKMSQRAVDKFCRQFQTLQTNQWEMGRELGSLLHPELPALTLSGVSTHTGDEPLGWSSTAALGHHDAPSWVVTLKVMPLIYTNYLVSSLQSFLYKQPEKNPD